MKTRYKILLICSGIIILISFLQTPSIFGQPDCIWQIGTILTTTMYNCGSWSNWNWIYYNTFERDRLDCIGEKHVWIASKNSCIVYPTTPFR